MNIVEVSSLSKYFYVYKKDPGFLGSLKSLIHRKYETVKAVDSINFTIEKGEMVGFIGPNGAGKTTTLKMLSGLLYPTQGKATVLGFSPWERKEEFQKQFTIVMGQKNQLWWDLPAMETFLLQKEIYEVPEEKFSKTLSMLVDLLEMKQILHIPVRRLSLGQRMKAELVASLLHSPKVLFLDEPTIGLDVVMQRRIREFIREYNRRTQATVILTSHYMEDVKELCPRVIVIDHGKIAYDGALQKLVDTYVDHKMLNPVFSEEVNKNNLKKIGDILFFEPPQAKIRVKRQDVSKKAAELLSLFPVADLTIEEVPIEDVIEEIFTGQDHA
ncbi:MAG TPA: ABC transporter ATP-binding protein [Patescibacteria group bacterium]|nr:ABC transporter ATP-binding protein [Patescibacteria group bacterium]